MTLSDVAIRRPVFTTMILLAIVVFGLISYREIGIDLFPRVEFPVVTIVSVLPGGDPETMEITVSDVIEEGVATISGIKNLRSTSSDGISQVVIEFELEKDINVAYQEVQAKLAAVRAELPDDLEEPIVEKLDIDASPIMSVVLSGNLPIQEMTRLADKTVKERLQRIKNVGQVKVVGGRERKIWIWLDAGKLTGHYLTVQDVQAALKAEHVEFPGGRIESASREWTLKTKAEFTSAEELSQLIVAYREGAAIRVRDIGRVEDGMEEERSYASKDGVRAVALLVRRQSGTNTVEVAHAVKKELEKLNQELNAQGVSLVVAQDQSIFIEHSLHEVRFHLVFGGGLAILIVFLFLRNIRSTFISSLVIPTSLIGTFFVMRQLDFTQNNMTLLGLSLAIGLLIDDAIVVQENIMRHIEEGETPPEAARKATSEIALAVLATTLSVVAVFVPVAFMEGQVGRFMFQFGITVAVSVLISMFISFTLDPMLSSRLLRKPNPGPIYRASEAVFKGVELLYKGLLRAGLRARWLVIIIAAGLFATSIYYARYLRLEFFPQEDQSEFNIRVRAPLGSSLETTREILENIRAKIAGTPWIEYTFTTLGADELKRVNEGAIYVKMVEKEHRPEGLTQFTGMAWARDRMADVTGAKVGVEMVPRFAGGGRKWSDLQLELRGDDLVYLDNLAQTLMAKMRTIPGYLDVDCSYDKDKPEVNIYPKRDAAADMGVRPADIAATLRALIGGQDVAKFKAQGDRYDIAVRLTENFRNSPEIIPGLTIRSRNGELVRLQGVSRVQTETGPVQIDRYNRSRQVTITANLDKKNRVLGEAIEEMTAVLDKIKLPPGHYYGFAGMADNMREGVANMVFAFFLSLIIVYMLLAAQFESFIHPFTIMMALPLSIIGAVAALLLSQMTMSIYTMIGIIFLMGLVTKNGILLVDYISESRRRGMERREAILHAAPARLRPILMTTFAIVFGMLPIALGEGSGSESRASMAVAVIGGLIASTLLTLVVVPAVYTILDDFSHPSQWRLVRLFRR